MRLSTSPARDETRAIAVIHAALDAGVRLLDTADAYCLDDSETGHNERLIAKALRSWSGDPAAVTVATKGGLRRPGGAWVPDGRAKHLRAACEASRRALGVDCIDVYQLHAVDPRTPLETSVRALAALRRDGLIRRIGLCNVNVGQIEAARAIAEIASVQVSFSVLDDENLRNGVVAYCREHGIQLIAYRPLGGERGVQRIAGDPRLVEMARRYDVTPAEVALLWLHGLGDHVVPIPGATRIETVRSIGRVPAIALSLQDRAQLDDWFGRGLGPQERRAPVVRRAASEVVLVMGMPAVGKSTVAEEFVAAGYTRLNRDTTGGRLSGLIPALEDALRSGRSCVLDNTYASRSARNHVVDCATRLGVPVRCIRLTTSLPDAQVNAIGRLLQAHGRLPMPPELRALGRTDHRYFGPDAQFRYERQLEPPVPEEGFSSIEERSFQRRPRDDEDPAARALVIDWDAVAGDAAEWSRAVARLRAEGWHVLVTAWRPGAGDDNAATMAELAALEREVATCGIDAGVAICPHPAGPPICWCRKPLPGLLLEFALRHRVPIANCVMIGRSQADRTLAKRLGVALHEPLEFFGLTRLTNNS